MRGVIGREIDSWSHPFGGPAAPATRRTHIGTRSSGLSRLILRSRFQAREQLPQQRYEDSLVFLG